MHFWSLVTLLQTPNAETVICSRYFSCCSQLLNHPVVRCIWDFEGQAVLWTNGQLSFRAPTQLDSMPPHAHLLHLLCRPFKSNWPIQMCNNWVARGFAHYHTFFNNNGFVALIGSSPFLLVVLLNSDQLPYTEWSNKFPWVYISMQISDDDITGFLFANWLFRLFPSLAVFLVSFSRMNRCVN